jgi:arsenate reductase
MLVLGLQGSPRKNGNTDFLLSSFMAAVEKLGIPTQTIHVTRKNILPCRELIVCEKKGFCPIDDDMPQEIYPLLRQAEIVVAATPIFFYNMTAQLKALVDRCQVFWARKYLLKLSDPASKVRKGFLLSVAATRGKHLFEGLELTVRYFFDAIAADFAGSLVYRGIEGRGEMAGHAYVLSDVEKAVQDLLQPYLGRKRILFACRQNACRSQMAGAFAQYLAGDRLEVVSAGSEPAAAVDPNMTTVMREKGIDMEFRVPRSIETAISGRSPEMIITMGCGESCAGISGAEVRSWDVADPAEKPLDAMRQVRDDIEKRVVDLIAELF